jgi:putative transposase
MASRQTELRFPKTWGGARDGAGRPKGRTSKRIPHVARPPVSRHRPHHITVRTTRGTSNLRSERCYKLVRGALSAVKKDRAGFRVVHFSVQHNHMHLIVEANDRRSLTNAMRALLIRVARGLNGLLNARGSRFDDRYHEHVLETPTETRNALLYVIGNRGVHLARLGKSAADGFDPFSSLVCDELIQGPRSWLLRVGWKGPP